MVKLWARILMALVFVFATMTSPLHAQAMPAMSHGPEAAPAAASMHMEGMSAECEKAMKAAAETVKPHKTGHANHEGGCCSNGCNCPLSHCPVTQPLLLGEVATLFHYGQAIVPVSAEQYATSYLADTLKRPPRA